MWTREFKSSWLSPSQNHKALRLSLSLESLKSSPSLESHCDFTCESHRMAPTRGLCHLGWVRVEIMSHLVRDE